MPVRILLADDHRMIRTGLRVLLEPEASMQVVGEADDGRTAVALAAELSPDVVVMDLKMPDLNGIEATRQAIAHNPSVKIIGLSADSQHQTAVAMLRAGASGFVMKEAAFDELVMAIQTVMKGRVYLSPSLVGTILEAYTHPDLNAESGAFGVLSPREREVLQLIAEGKATKEVALHLHVSIKTIETHRRNVMEKLHMDSVAELTKYAIREGLTAL